MNENQKIKIMNSESYKEMKKRNLINERDISHLHPVFAEFLANDQLKNCFFCFLSITKTKYELYSIEEMRYVLDELYKKYSKDDYDFDINIEYEKNINNEEFFTVVLTVYDDEINFGYDPENINISEICDENMIHDLTKLHNFHFTRHSAFNLSDQALKNLEIIIHERVNRFEKIPRNSYIDEIKEEMTL